jgi:uncharacterized membrane protein YkvA (DUF1232 family)
MLQSAQHLLHNVGVSVVVDGAFGVVGTALLGAAAGLLLLWLCLVGALLVAGTGRRRPRLAEVLRLLPDLLVLLQRLAWDGSLPRVVRVLLLLLLVYLALPFDLIPDFVPIAGYADDAIIVAVALRFTVRRAGAEAVTRHWSGSDAALATVLRAAGLSGAGSTRG